MVARTELAHASSAAATPPEASGPLTPREAAAWDALPVEVRYVYHETFDSPSAEGELLKCAPALPPAWVYHPDGSLYAPAEVQAFRLTARQEAELFLRFNYARYRLAMLRERHPAGAGRPGPRTARRMLRWFALAQELRAVLVRANLPLVLTMARRHGPRDVEFPELVSEGNLVLLRCVESFDAGRGYKFSTYACRAIIKGFHRLAAGVRRHRQRFPIEFDPDLEKSDESERRDRANREGILHDLRRLLSGGQCGLRPVERRIVMERFGIGEGGGGKTLSAVSQVVGLSPERVRQLQHIALEKLREALTGRRVPA